MSNEEMAIIDEIEEEEKELQDATLADLAPRANDPVNVRINVVGNMGKKVKIDFKVRQGLAAPIVSNVKRQVTEYTTSGGDSSVKFNFDLYIGLLWDYIVLDQPEWFKREIRNFVTDLKNISKHTNASDFKPRCKIDHNIMTNILTTVYAAFEKSYDEAEATEYLQKNLKP